jgi:hypothetical protein
MHKIGDTVIDNNKASFYKGRKVVIKNITHFDNCTVYTVEYNGNISYALRDTTVTEA